MATLPPPPTSVDDALYRWLYLAYQAILVAGGGSTPSGDFGDPGINTPNAALVPNTNRAIDYLALSQLALNTVLVTSTADELNQLDGSNITRSSLSSLQNYSDAAHTFNFGVSAEAGDVITVELQAVDANGDALTSPVAGFIYLSDLADGSRFATIAPDGGITLGADGDLQTITTSLGADMLIQFVTSADGSLELLFTHSTTGTWYAAVTGAYNKLTVSSEITFV